MYLLYRWAWRRDRRAGAILCAAATGYLPWSLYQDRTVFSFCAVVFVPYPCLAVTMALGALLGPPGVTRRPRAYGSIAAGVLILLVAWNFIRPFPICTGRTIPYADWHARMRPDTWI